MSASVLFNGAPVDDASVQSRGLHYGDGVFRTLLVVEGQIVDWPQQWSKLSADCAVLGLRAPDPAQLQAELTTLSAGHVWAHAKVLVIRQWRQRGYAPTTDASDRLVWVSGLAERPVSAPLAGIDVSLSSIRLGEQPALAGVKHLNRLEQVLASRSWPAGVGEVLMLDTGGRLIAGTRSNVFCVRAGRLQTPNLHRCGVAGVMRQRVLDVCTVEGLPVDLIDLSWSDFIDGSEAFVCNALMGIVPVSGCGERRWDSPGPLTRRLRSLLSHPCHALNS